MDLKKLIAQHKSLARKAVALETILPTSAYIDNEKAFLAADFSQVETFADLMGKVHDTRHKGLIKAQKYTRCKLCKALMGQMEEQPADILPRFGNLLSILEKEVADERAKIESKKMPSQNDLTRWAMKNAVLLYYQGLKGRFPDDKPIIMNRMDQRLIDELAPDFDAIAKIWLQELDRLKQRSDIYTLNEDEMDKAEADLAEKMQGSAFEKALDRYRAEFMTKLPK